MKLSNKLAFFIVLLLITANTFSQSPPSANRPMLIAQTININDSLINHRPFIKKGLFYFLRSRVYKKCQIVEALNIGMAPIKDSVILVITSKRTKVRPVIKRYSNADLTSARLKQDLVSVVETMTQSDHCDRCVDGFLSYYSLYLLDTSTIHKDFFDVKVTAKGNSEIKSILSPNTAKASTDIIFPLNAATGGTYTVYQGDQLIQNGGLFYLPQNFKIIVDPGVNNISWQFDQMQFDDGAEIDLSQRDNPAYAFGKPPTPDPISDQYVVYNCCNPCHIETITNKQTGQVIQYGNGARGEDGANGTQAQNGRSGTNFTLIITSAFNITSGGGSLWIRTDGTNGSDGGDGGNAGKGSRGGGNCLSGWNGGNGGDGGQGMPGGSGGNTSTVIFEDISGTIIQRPVPSQFFSPSTRPLQVTGPTGLIAIYGNPGAGGRGGVGGKGGERGHGCNLGSFCTGKSNDGNNGADRTPERLPDGPNGQVMP